MIHRPNSSQRGDTLVEVLLAMVVIGLVLGGAFSLANRAQRTGLAAQERTKALKIAESQLELTKAYLKNGASNVGAHSEFCIDSATTTPLSASLDSADGKCMGIDGSGNDGLYTIKISETGGTYSVEVSWEHVNSSLGTTSLTLFYRAGVL